MSLASHGNIYVANLELIMGFFNYLVSWIQCVLTLGAELFGKLKELDEFLNLYSFVISNVVGPRKDFNSHQKR